MGVAGYSEIAHILGLNSVAERYADIAKKMAMKWEEMANEGDHYRLAFDRNNTWSQKYNIRNQLLSDKAESIWIAIRFPQRLHKIRLDYVDSSHVSKP